MEPYEVHDPAPLIVGSSIGGLVLLALITAGLYKVALSHPFLPHPALDGPSACPQVPCHSAARVLRTAASDVAVGAPGHLSLLGVD